MPPKLPKRATHSSNDEGTPAKRPRHHEVNNVDASLLELPVEVIDRIIAKVSFRHQKNMRRASRRMREIHTDYMLHLHRSFKHRQLSEAGEEQRSLLTMLQLVDQAIGFFVHYGYATQFGDSLLPFYGQLMDDERDHDKMLKMNSCLRHFQDGIERGASSKPALMQRRLLYTMSLLNLLRQFRTYRMIKSAMTLMHWQLLIEIAGASVTILEEREVTLREREHNKRVDFLAIIAELLHYDKLDTVEHRLIEMRTSLYAFGLVKKLKRRCPRLILKFTVVAPKSILSVLSRVLDGSFDLQNLVPPMSPNAAFNVRLEVITKSTMEWIGEHHMTIPIYN